MTKDKKKTWYIILNPAANGGHAAKQWKNIQQHLHVNEIDFVLEKTMGKNHATQLATNAIAAGYRKIIAVGGDGTANEVANGILQQTEIDSNQITFALLPCGTGNDWIKTHHIPKDLTSWIICLKKEKTVFQDVGLVNYTCAGKKESRYFINVAGMAYDAFAVKLSEGKKKTFFPKIYYLLLLVKGLFKYRLHAAHLSFDDQSIIDDFYTINIGIGKYSGGGMQLVPHAVFNDGQFALTYAGRISKLNIILNTYLFYNGGLLGHSKVEGVFTKKIKVETQNGQPTGVEVDGEYAGETPVEFTLFPLALKVLVP